MRFAPNFKCGREASSTTTATNVEVDNTVIKTALESVPISSVIRREPDRLSNTVTQAQRSFKMSITGNKELHSRSSADTHVPDLEKGEARPEKEEEEVLGDEVCRPYVLERNCSGFENDRRPSMRSRCLQVAL